MRIQMRNPHFFKEVIEAIENGQEVSFKVNGWSMLPFFFHDETVVTVKKEPINVGDIVLYKDGKVTLHRVVDRVGEELIIQGDGQYRHSASICEAAVIGKVIKYEHRNKVFHPDDIKLKKSVSRWLTLKRIPLSKVYLKYLRNRLKPR